MIFYAFDTISISWGGLFAITLAISQMFVPLGCNAVRHFFRPFRGFEDVADRLPAKWCFEIFSYRVDHLGLIHF